MNYHNHNHNPQPAGSSFYTCPIHPDITSDKPRMCSECGMSLVTSGKRQETSHSYDKHAGHSTQSFLKKFWVSLVLTVPVVIYSFDQGPVFSGSVYLPAILGSIIFFYGGWVFLKGAWIELGGRQPGMMTLIGLAIGTAYGYSIYVTVQGMTAPSEALAKEGLFWELTTLITIMLLGHWLEMKAVSGAQGALKELSKLLPDTAELVTNNQGQAFVPSSGRGATRIVPLSELKEGDAVLVRPGGKIPADGLVIEGESETNEAMITGESQPVKKAAGSEVIAGTINGDGALKIKITKIGQHTFLAGVMRLVEEAQASKSRLQVLSDRAAFYLTIIAVGAGGLTFALWILAQARVGFALERLVAVLVIACPHALGLAVPLVASISTTLAARHGFLVRQRLALELARKIDTVIFDKTGTLTTGLFSVTNASSDRILALAAAVETNSEHPIAGAIVAEAKKRNLAIAAAKNFKRIPGVGAEAEVENKKIFVGHRGKTDIRVEIDGEMAGTISVADTIRPEAKETVNLLKSMGRKLAMITGDSEETAKIVARELGIEEYYSRVLPGEKSQKVKDLQQKGLRVAMVGDGVNDAPALAQADLGIAIGAGTNVAIESAGIILVRNDPRDIVKIIKLSHLTYSKMIQNLFWATGYNVIALPLAAGALAFKGIILQPALAALFMSLSTVIVAINAVLLRKVKL